MATPHFDVLIIGAGLSGIGAGYHLQTHCPGRTFAILESRNAMGGTWDLFRYPGIRSDSDMFTLGYTFQPWREGKAIADGPSILRYIKDTAHQHGLDQHIRFNHRVLRYSWSSEEATWTLEAENPETGESTRFTCGFLINCTGYYRYDAGYTPEFKGRERFQGPIVHPQHWPEDLEYADKRVVVIGSGATAVTLLPNLARKARHVTMLQRSPSYVMAMPDEDPVARFLRRFLPLMLAYRLIRWKNVSLQMIFYQFCMRFPKMARKVLRRHLKSELGPEFDLDTHFNPRYNPWEQRLCLAPNGDIFRAMAAGKASVVTDHIDTFTETGIRLASGRELEADIIVTATGLNLLALGGAEVVVDGTPVNLPDTMNYKGMMLSGIPNLTLAIGYTNASWTLKADLTHLYTCRLLNYMTEQGYDYCAPRHDPAVGTAPFLDLSAGYVQRSLDDIPKQGDRAPWRLYQNYLLDLLNLRFGSVNDSAMEFHRRAPASGPQSAAAGEPDRSNSSPPAP